MAKKGEEILKCKHGFKISCEVNYYWTSCSQHKKCNSSQKAENV